MSCQRQGTIILDKYIKKQHFVSLQLKSHQLMLITSAFKHVIPYILPIVIYAIDTMFMQRVF